MAMRDQIYEAIVKGGATAESLLQLTGTTKKGLASQFTYLRMMGKCPRKKDDGTYEIVSAEEWEASRASGGTTGKILTPEERVEKARKREQRAAAAQTNAEKRLEANPDDRLNQLQAEKCNIELEISSILLGQAEADARAATDGVEDGDVEDVEDDDDIEDDLE